MGLRFYDLASLPALYDVVWCKFPKREDPLIPGPVVRPTLVVDVTIVEDQRNNQRLGAVTVQYGGDYDDRHLPKNLVIGAGEFRPLGLHKPTLFRMDLRNRRTLPWAEEYFVTQDYVRSQNLIAGSLNNSQRARMHECLKQRGQSFPISPAL